jgi:hypothetical protein
MLEKDLKAAVHNSCPNRYHCIKDESKCCYLLSNRKCYLDSEKARDYL